MVKTFDDICNRLDTITGRDGRTDGRSFHITIARHHADEQ